MFRVTCLFYAGDPAEKVFQLDAWSQVPNYCDETPLYLVRVGGYESERDARQCARMTNCQLRAAGSTARAHVDI